MATVFHLTNRFRIADNNLNKPRPIKRVVGGRNETRLREASFIHHPITQGSLYGGQYGWVSPFIIEVRKCLNLQVE
jgi:hypothetical protein